MLFLSPSVLALSQRSLSFALPRQLDKRANETIVGLQAAQPHLEDHSTYHPLRPTRLDKIKNLHIEVRSGSVTKPLGRLDAKRDLTG